MSPERRPRVAFVVQRYGEEVVGGAETHARQLAERMVSDLGWQVTVFTTCARDYQTWANEFIAGRSEVRGVEVLRFPTLVPRFRWLFGGYSRLLRWILGHPGLPGRRAWAPMLERAWVALQGPYAPSLLSVLERRQREFSACFFITYLYWPAVRGLRLLQIPKFLIPTAHDEFALYFGEIQGSMKQADALLANGETERELLARVLGRPRESIATVGVGFADFDEPGPCAPRGRHLLYLGRLARGKDLPMLMSTFVRRAEAHPASEVELVLAGSHDPALEIPAHPRIRYVGFVSEEERRRLTATALAVVNPSAHESLSMVVFEALANRTPVVVNQESPVLARYAEQVETVYGFSGESGLGEVLDQVLSQDWDSPQARERLARARDWGRQRYSWAAVLSRLREAASRLVPELAWDADRRSVEPEA